MTVQVDMSVEEDDELAGIADALIAVSGKSTDELLALSDDDKNELLAMAVQKSPRLLQQIERAYQKAQTRIPRQ